MPTSRRTRNIAVAAVATLGFATQDAGASAASARVARPACDRIAGVALAIDARWRIVEVSLTPKSDVPSEITVACRRGAPAGTAPYVLAHDDSLYGRSVVAALVGDRVLVDEVNGSSSADSTAQRLIDLRTGKSAATGFESNGYNPPLTESSLEVMTADGSVFSDRWTSTTDASDVTTTVILPMKQWSRAGVEQPGPAGRYLSAVLASRKATPSAYYVTSDHHVSAISAPSKATGPKLTDDVPVTRLPLPVLSRTETAGRHELGFVVAGVAAANQGPAATVVTERRGRHIAYRLELQNRTLPSNLAPVVRLASDRVQLLDRSWNVVLVRARFADDPRHDRIRLIDDNGAVKLDLPDDPTAVAAHSLMLRGDDEVVVAGHDQVTLYDVPQSGRPRVATVSIPGVHAVSTNQHAATVYFTNRAGNAGALWPDDTSVCKPGLDAAGQCPTFPTPAPSRFVPDGSFTPLAQPAAG